MQYLKTTAQLVVIFLVSVGVSNAQNAAWLNSVANGVYGVVPSLVALLVGLAVVYFLWGLVVFVANAGSDQARTEGKKSMVWGIIFIFAIVSVWGLVSLLRTVSGIGNGTTPSAPQTTYN